MREAQVENQINKEPYVTSSATVKLIDDRQPSDYEVLGISSEFKNKVMVRVKHHRLGYDFYLDLTTEDWKHIGQPMVGDRLHIKLEIAGYGS
jgi:hypothetical protein